MGKKTVKGFSISSLVITIVNYVVGGFTIFCAYSAKHLLATKQADDPGAGLGIALAAVMIIAIFVICCIANAVLSTVSISFSAIALSKNIDNQVKRWPLILYIVLNGILVIALAICCLLVFLN